MFKKLNKIKIKLTLLLLLVSIIPMLFSVLLAVKSVKQTRIKNIQELEKQLITQLNERFKKFIDDKIETYRINIADPNILAIGIEQQNFILKGLLIDDATLQEASFINTQGVIESYVNRDSFITHAEKLDVSNEKSFLTALKGNDYVSEIYFNSKTPQITIASPVVNQAGNIISIVRTKANLNGLSDMMQKNILGKKGYSYVTDKNGKIIASSEGLNKNIIGEKSLNPLLPLAEEKKINFIDNITTNLSNELILSATKKIPSLNWIIFTEWPEEDAMAIINKIIKGIWIFTAITIIIIIILSIIFSRTLLKPLQTLKNGTNAISKGNFNINLKIKTGDEFEDLGRNFNSMAIDLKKFHEMQKTKQKHLENAFGQYVGGSMIKGILKGEKIKLGGERKYITILFSDIKNFTTISETLEPEVLIKYLNKYLTVMTDIIIKHGGVIDKYIGDAILAFWGAPEKQEDHALRASLAAEEMIKELKNIQKEWSDNGLPEIDIRIGLNSGGVLVGNVGSKQRLAYTVIGDPVNLASRLEAINKYYKTRVMISQSTFMEIKDKAITREVDKVEVKGKTKGIKIYELVSIKNKIDVDDKKIIKKYEEALAFYRARKWNTAIKIFAKIIDIKPDDGPSLTLMARAQIYSKNPPDIEWDGVYKATEK